MIIFIWMENKMKMHLHRVTSSILIASGNAYFQVFVWLCASIMLFYFMLNQINLLLRSIVHYFKFQFLP